MYKHTLTPFGVSVCVLLYKCTRTRVHMCYPLWGVTHVNTHEREYILEKNEISSLWWEIKEIPT